MLGIVTPSMLSDPLVEAIGWLFPAAYMLQAVNSAKERPNQPPVAAPTTAFRDMLVVIFSFNEL